MSKDQNASGNFFWGNDAWSDAIRYLERYPKSAEVDRTPDLERRRQLLPDFEEHGRKHQNGCGKSRAAASGGPYRHYYLVPASLPAVVKIEWTISVKKGVENNLTLWGGKYLEFYQKLTDNTNINYLIIYISYHWWNLIKNCRDLFIYIYIMSLCKSVCV
jgi:hypothetical protein